MHCDLSRTMGIECSSSGGAQGNRAGEMLGCLTCGSAMWRAHSSKWDPPSRLWWCKFNELPSFHAVPAAHRQSFNSILCGCSNHSCSCYLDKPIKHLLMMILSLDQWGKLTYKKPGFLTSQPGIVLTSGKGIMCLCCPIPKVCLLQTVLNIHSNV